MEFEIEKATEVLARTPRVVRAMLDGLSPEWTSGGSETDWAPFDIVGHLIHGEITDWIPRARIILDQDESVTFVPFDRLAQFEHSKGKTLAVLLDEFYEARRDSLTTLRSWDLTDNQLRLKGMHPELGEVDLSQLLSTWVVHDLTHIRQLATFMAKKYTVAVGPWTEYLSILK